MNTLKGKNVIITGASNGIGRACAIAYAGMGCNLILMGRKEDALLAVKGEILSENNIEIHTIATDLRDYEMLKKEIENIPENLKKIEILVNNAGLAIGLDKLYLNQEQDMDNVVDTNIKGLLYMIQLIVPIILEHGLGGHIVNLGSVAGNAAYAGGAVYCATKAAVKTISDGLRIDLVDQPIRVTTILPGMVETDFSLVRFKGDSQRASSVYKGIEALTPADVADTIVYATNLPKNVQITDLTLTPLHQANGTNLYRQNN